MRIPHSWVLRRFFLLKLLLLPFQLFLFRNTEILSHTWIMNWWWTQHALGKCLRNPPTVQRLTVSIAYSHAAMWLYQQTTVMRTTDANRSHIYTSWLMCIQNHPQLITFTELRWVVFYNFPQRALRLVWGVLKIFHLENCIGAEGTRLMLKRKAVFWWGKAFLVQLEIYQIFKPFMVLLKPI